MVFWLSVDISNLRRSWVLIFGQILVLMCTSKPPNMKVKLQVAFEIDSYFDFGTVFFFEKKNKARAGNDLDL